MLPQANIAIEHTKQLDTIGDKCLNSVGTHVYKLVEKLIK